MYTCAHMCVCARVHACARACVCVFVHAHLYYGVQEYTYLSRGIWRHASLGEIWVLRLYNVAFEAILDHSRPIFKLK